MCDQCEAVTINGVYCHEHGCPKAPAICDCCEEEFIPKFKGDNICQACHDDEYEDPTDFLDDEEQWARQRFADPGGESALHAETATDKRIYPCPTCHQPNRLTRKDKQSHYQCDACAKRDEGGGY